jgi:hypothetical protein
VDCSSPLELFAGRQPLESAGGPAHSTTLRYNSIEHLSCRSLAFAESFTFMNHTPASQDPIASCLVDIISDGFNRSLSALVEAGVIDDCRLREHYKGVGSKYYDLVSEQIECTARYGAASIRKLVSS